MSRPAASGAMPSRSSGSTTTRWPRRRECRAPESASASRGGLYRDNGTQAFVADENAGTWGGAQKIAGNLNVGGNAGVTAVSCTPATNCTAGGFYTDAAGHQSGWVADDSTATTTTLSTSAFSVAAGQEQQERITVTVAPLTGGTPTGTVTVSASGSTVCTITLSGGHGSCTLRASQLPKGNYLLTANYGGDGSYLGSFDNSNKMFTCSRRVPRPPPG